MSTASLPFLPYGRHCIDEDDVAAVVSVLKSGWLTTGPVVEAFEKAFAEKAGARYAVACNSGTAGLHLAAMALGLREGDVVIVPTLTFLATANAARFVGAEVVFADVDPLTGLMGEDNLQDAVSRSKGRARAIFPIHLNGQCVDMGMVARVAQKHGLAIVEDACHAVGGTYESNGVALPVGACHHGDMAVFSLHPVKTVTMGEGGVVTTNDPVLRDKLLRFRNHGMVRDAALFETRDLAFDSQGEPNPWYYEMPEPGYNYRASDINCALGLSQLGKLEDFVARRTELAALYGRLLAPLTPHLHPVAQNSAIATPAWHLYVVLIDFDAAGTSRAQVIRTLREEGIGTQVHYLPVHHQPYYRNRYGNVDLSGADSYYARCLSIPLFPDMTDRDVKHVVTSLRQALNIS